MIWESLQDFLTGAPVAGAVLFGLGYLVRQCSEAFVRISAERREWRRLEPASLTRGSGP